MCESLKLREFSLLPANQYHFDGKNHGPGVWSNAAEYHYTTIWLRRFSTPAQYLDRFTVWPIVNNPSQIINVRARGQWIKETLTGGLNSILHACRAEIVSRKSNCSGQINQSSGEMSMESQDLSKHRSSASSYVNNIPH